MLEVVVTGAVLAVVTALLAPTGREVLRRYRVATVASQIGLELTRTRTLAVARSRPTRMRLSGTGAYWYEHLDDTTEQWVQEEDVSGGEVPDSVEMDVDGTGVTGAPASGLAIAFYPNGLADGTYILSFSSGGVTRYVRVNVMGRVEVLATATSG